MWDVKYYHSCLPTKEGLDCFGPNIGLCKTTPASWVVVGCKASLLHKALSQERPRSHPGVGATYASLTPAKCSCSKKELPTGSFSSPYLLILFMVSTTAAIFVVEMASSRAPAMVSMLVTKASSSDNSVSGSGDLVIGSGDSVSSFENSVSCSVSMVVCALLQPHVG